MKYDLTPMVMFLITMIVILFLHGFSEIQRNLTRNTTRIESLEATIKKQQELLGDISADLTVLDDAVHVDSKRRVKIIKLRNAIKEIVRFINTTETRNLSPVDISEIATAVVDNGEKYSVPNSLLLAIIRQESAFNIRAVSPAGAQGLTQVLPATAFDIKGWLGKPYYDPFKATQNIQFGAFYIGKLLQQFNYRIEYAIMGYNTGPENVVRFLGGTQPLHPQTVDYLEKVTTYMEEYKGYGID